MRMMRERTMSQEKLYQQYASLGRRMTGTTKQHNHDDEWNLVTQEGFWKLPVTIRYDGLGLTWKEYVIALEGLTTTYCNQTLYSSLVSHSTAIYFLLTYGTRQQKTDYLSRIVNGENASILVNQFSTKTNVPLHVLLAKEKKYPLKQLANSKIIILITDDPHSTEKDDIGFLIMNNDRELMKNIQAGRYITTSNFLFDQSEHYKRNLFLPKDRGFKIFFELINFERLLYGIIASVFSEAIIKKSKEAFQPLLTNPILQKTYEGIEKNIQTSRTAFYSLLRESKTLPT